MSYDAFLSYRRENGFLMAQVIRDRLEEKGLHCFLDLEELRSGHFDEKILLAIQEAHTFILILPKNALTRCSNEVNTKLKTKTSEKQITSDTVGFFWEMIQQLGDEACVDMAFHAVNYI